MAKYTPAQLANMKKNGYTKEEMEELAKYDEMIDKGLPVPFDLTPEQEKDVKKYIITTGTKKIVPKEEKKPKTRKENATKGSIIAELAEFLQKMSENACENVEITNKERQIAFTIGGNAYELTLVQKRKPKK